MAVVSHLLERTPPSRRGTLKRHWLIFMTGELALLVKGVR